MTVTETGSFIPPQPETLEETGLAESAVEHLILKILYFRGDIFGQDLSTAISLRFSVIEGIVEQLKLRHLIQLKRSLGMGMVASVFALTETGRARAREYLDANQYAGAAPVPLAQYVEGVRQQRQRDGWLTKEALRKAFRNMVLTEHVFSQVGPAVSAANSLLIYGKPGDGKTFLVESLNNLDSAPIFLPQAIECQGNVVQLYDPVYHQRLEEEEPSVLAVSDEHPHDRRWVKCKRPFIVSGGELSLDMLDLRYNQNSKVYEAPFQLKANNGVYLIDDFGRQRATPAEVLNRWIVPMERRVDYLSFLTGGKMTAPFETFLVFSTNLNPADLGDEAFLRRIQYKMLLRGPSESEFVRIFEGFCASRKLACPRGLVSRFIEKRYRNGKPFRRCHPRDVLSHALNLMHFEKLPLELTDQILDRAFESCFLEEQEGDGVVEAPIAPAPSQSCSDYWGDKLAEILTAFGTLTFLASFRDSANGRYPEAASVQEYGEPETTRTLSRLHGRAFREWMSLNLDQQSRDLARYAASEEGGAELLSMQRVELAKTLTPEDAKPQESQLFSDNLGAVLDSIRPRVQESSIWGGSEKVERIA